MTLRSILLPTVLLVSTACLAGCGKDEGSADASASSESFDSLFASAAPANAVSVLALREGPKDGDSVTVVGRVSDFVPGIASFSLVDRKFIPCNEREGDSCATPWDYCCEDITELNRGKVNVEVHEGTSLVRQSLEGVHGLDRLVTVTVRGTLHVDEAQNLQLVAEALHVGG